MARPDPHLEWRMLTRHQSNFEFALGTAVILAIGTVFLLMIMLTETGQCRQEVNMQSVQVVRNKHDQPTRPIAPPRSP